MNLKDLSLEQLEEEINQRRKLQFKDFEKKKKDFSKALANFKKDYSKELSLLKNIPPIVVKISESLSIKFPIVCWCNYEDGEPSIYVGGEDLEISFVGDSASFLNKISETYGIDASNALAFLPAKFKKEVEKRIKIEREKIKPVTALIKKFFEKNYAGNDFDSEFINFIEKITE